MVNKELNAREWAEQKGVSYKQTLRWLADPTVRESKFPGAHQIQRGGTWFIPVDEQPRGLTQPLAVEEIVVEEERKQAILAHFEDLRAIAKRWNRELWLPPPWLWDVAHLEHVFYVDSEKVARGEGVAGYKLPADLVDSEKSKGHFRHFEKGDVHWIVRDDGSIALKLLVEHEVVFGHWKAHAQGSPALGLFDLWKEEAGNYIDLCSSLLARIEKDVKRAIRLESELSYWTIYHDAFCIRDTGYRCEACGTPNSAGSRFCQACYLLLGWLHPILKGYESTTESSQLSPIHIHGWGNIEELVPTDKIGDIVPAHKELVKKYQGCDLVEAILQREKAVKQFETRLREELVSLSQQRVFLGKCPACPR